VANESYDVFVSYARLDSRHATELDSILRAKGLKPFFDRRNLSPGLPWAGALPWTQPGRPRDANPTTLLQDARDKVPRAHDIGKNKLADYLKKQWQCTSHGGVARGYNFPPLAEMRNIWDKRFGQREWSKQADWGVAARPDLLE
jgi:hypothetical protein